MYAAHAGLAKKKKKISHGFLPLRYDTLFCILEKHCLKNFYTTDSACSNYSEYSALQCTPRQVNYTKYLGGIPFCTARL